MNWPVKLVVLLSSAALFMTCATNKPVHIEGENPDNEFLTTLETNKARIMAADQGLIPAYRLLLEDAERAFVADPPSVMDKQFIPPSGDKHDYMSMAPYWWPNPETDDGLPYIRKDGEVNPERNAYDKLTGALMSEAVRALALAYYFTEEERYAMKASEYLRTWFLEPETRMHPNLNFGQFIPGYSEGRSVGIIESRNFVFLKDYEPLLQNSDSWTESDHLSFVTWMNEFRVWLVSSDLGQQEFNHTNNHGTWYDYQVLALSQYCGKMAEAKEFAMGLMDRRVVKQIDRSGKQAEEIVRTKSFNYSVFNLQALTYIAREAEIYGIDLYALNSEDQRIRKAIDFLLPYALGESEWPYPQIFPLDHAREPLIFILDAAYGRHKLPEYKKALDYLKGQYPVSRYHLTTVT